MSDTYWLCAAGVTLRSQIDRRWPGRDKASDGWIGDPSHQARVSDHNPCWTCKADRYGVVRAIDIDVDLDPADPKAAQRLANQLIEKARTGSKTRLSYVIYNRQIASGTYQTSFWTWRPYTGPDPHTNHIHVSFTALGDFNGGEFDLPIFVEPAVKATRSRIKALTARIKTLLSRRAKARTNLEDLLK